MMTFSHKCEKIFWTSKKFGESSNKIQIGLKRLEKLDFQLEKGWTGAKGGAWKYTSK